MESLFKDLKTTENITVERILNRLLEADDNLALKTHINAPVELTALSMLAEWLENNNCKRSSDTLQFFILYFLKYMVSYKRMSRTEVIKALSNRMLMKDDVELRKKLMGVNE